MNAPSCSFLQHTRKKHIAIQHFRQLKLTSMPTAVLDHGMMVNYFTTIGVVLLLN